LLKWAVLTNREDNDCLCNEAARVTDATPTGSEGGTARLAVRLLGEPSLEFDRKPWPLKAPFRCFAILAMLSLSSGDPPSRESIASDVWPNLTNEEAMANLRRHLHIIQRALPDLGGNKWIVRNGSLLSWDEAAPVWVDVAEFRAAVGDPALRRRAVELYRGPLLGKRGDNELLFLSLRDRLRTECIDACREEALVARKQLDFAAATRYAEKMLEMAEFREDALRLAMSLRYESGDRSSALALFERFSLHLSDAMGVDPMPETLALRDTILMNEDVPVGAVESDEENALGLELLGVPFVGRTRELELLKSAWRGARRGRGKTLFVLGEAGIGKTRLLSEFGSSIALQGGRVVVGETSAPEAYPYEPLVDALRKSLALIVESPVRQPWLSSIAELLPELQAAFPDMAPAEPLAADNARIRLLEAIARTIERLAKVRPLLLVLEDLHWAGSATLDTVEYLARRIGAVGALVVITYRTGESAPGGMLHSLRRRLLAESRATSMELQPLDAVDVETLAGVMPGIPNPIDVAASVFKIGEGNPLFTAQMLRGYSETGVLALEYTAAATMAQAILSRVATLDSAAKDLLEVAATIGHSFTIDLLAAVLGWPEGHVVDSMSGPLDRSLIRVTRSGSTFAYSFTHELIARSIYETIPRERRAPYHRRIAGLLTALYGSDKRMAGTIALNWERSGATDRAAAAYLQAAQAALDVHDRDSAVAFARRAESLTSNDRERFCAYHVEALARVGWGSVEEWDEALRGLERSAAALGNQERFDAALLRSRHAMQTGDHDVHGAAVAQMLDLAAEAQNEAWRMTALDWLGFRLMISNDPIPAAKAFEQGLSIARVSGNHRLAVRFKTRLIQNQAWYGDVSAGLAGVEDLRRELVGNSSTDLRMDVLVAETWLAAEIEDAVRCKRVGLERMALAQSTGDMSVEAGSHGLLAHASHLERDATGMRAHTVKALGLFERLGQRRDVAVVHFNHGVFEREIGHFDRALHLYHVAETNEQFLEPDGLCALALRRADIALSRGDLPDAARLSADGFALSRRCHSQRFDVEALHALGAIQVRAGEFDAGMENLSQALAKATGGIAERTHGDILCTIVDGLVAEGKSAVAEPFAAALERRMLEKPESQRFPTQACATLAGYYRARGNAASGQWLQRGRARLEKALARFDLQEDRDAFSAMPFNRDLLAIA
jgi:DNA-binding SARP family transcriptional activator